MSKKHQDPIIINSNSAGPVAWVAIFGFLALIFGPTLMRGMSPPAAPPAQASNPVSVSQNVSVTVPPTRGINPVLNPVVSPVRVPIINGTIVEVVPEVDLPWNCESRCFWGYTPEH